MNPESPLSREAIRLGRAIRFAFVSFVLSLSYFTLRATWMIPGLEQVFRDMLNGKPLPALTVFVIKARYLFVASSVLVPSVAVGMLFSRHLVASFYLLGGLCMLVMVQFLVLYQGLSAPLFEIIQAMQGG